MNSRAMLDSKGHVGLFATFQGPQRFEIAAQFIAVEASEHIKLRGSLSDYCDIGPPSSDAQLASDPRFFEMRLHSSLRENAEPLQEFWSAVLSAGPQCDAGLRFDAMSVPVKPASKGPHSPSSSLEEAAFTLRATGDASPFGYTKRRLSPTEPMAAGLEMDLRLGGGERVVSWSPQKKVPVLNSKGKSTTEVFVQATADTTVEDLCKQAAADRKFATESDQKGYCGRLFEASRLRLGFLYNGNTYTLNKDITCAEFNFHAQTSLIFYVSEHPSQLLAKAKEATDSDPETTALEVAVAVAAEILLRPTEHRALLLPYEDYAIRFLEDIKDQQGGFHNYFHRLQYFD